MRSALAALALAAWPLAACTVVEREQLAVPDPVVRTATPERVWRVLAGGREVGSVVLFRSAAGENTREGSFFSVRNTWNQDVGLVDELGRAWAFRPHQREAEWLGAGTVASGAARILASEECELVEQSLGDATARPLPAVSRSH